jgi:hypothetical protein
MHFFDDGLQRRWSLQRRRFFMQNRCHGRDRILSVKRPLPAEQLIQHGAEAEHIRARVQRLALGLLRSHVRRRAQHRPFDRRRLFGISHVFRQSEI